MAFLVWPDKDPEEQLDYPIDFSDWVATGKTIENADAVVESSTPDESPAFGLTVDFVQAASDIVNVWLSGGTVGTTYIIKVTVDDNETSPEERVGVRRVKLKVKQK